MIDMYLKFTSEAEATVALNGYEGSIDVVGVIYVRTGGTDEEPVMRAVPGWHVNVRGPRNFELEVFSILPVNPQRVWA